MDKQHMYPPDWTAGYHRESSGVSGGKARGGVEEREDKVRMDTMHPMKRYAMEEGVYSRNAVSDAQMYAASQEQDMTIPTGNARGAMRSDSPYPFYAQNQSYKTPNDSAETPPRNRREAEYDAYYASTRQYHREWVSDEHRIPTSGHYHQDQKYPPPPGYSQRASAFTSSPGSNRPREEWRPHDHRQQQQQQQPDASSFREWDGRKSHYTPPYSGSHSSADPMTNHHRQEGKEPEYHASRQDRDAATRSNLHASSGYPPEQHYYHDQHYYHPRRHYEMQQHHHHHGGMMYWGHPGGANSTWYNPRAYGMYPDHAHPPPTHAAHPYHHHHQVSESSKAPRSSPSDQYTNAPLIVAKRTRRPKRERDKDKPKRPLSAYNLFFKDERVKMLADLGLDKSPTEDGEDDDDGNKVGNKADNYTVDDIEAKKQKVGPPTNTPTASPTDDDKASKKTKGVGFAPMAKQIAAKWKDIDEATLEKYKGLAADDMERYRKEMEVYRNKQGQGILSSPEDKERDIMKNQEPKKSP